MGVSATAYPPVHVLVGPRADARALARWAHAEFRESSAVAFMGVDAGLVPLLDAGLPATLAIGDFDGAAGLLRLAKTGDVPTIRLPRVKERSDLAAALAFSSSRRARIVYGFGFQGGRADHELGVHFDFSQASRHVPRIVSIGEKGAVFYLDARFAPLALNSRDIDAQRFASAVKPAPNSTAKRIRIASLFPIGGKATGVRLRGLRFPAIDGILSPSSQGLSNEIRAREIEIGIRRGRVALFFPN